MQSRMSRMHSDNEQTSHFLCLYFNSSPHRQLAQKSLIQYSVVPSFLKALSLSLLLFTTPTMFLSNRRLAALALTAITQFTVQAVQLTNDAYTGITAGSPFTLKWSGNGSVRIPPTHSQLA